MACGGGCCGDNKAPSIPIKVPLTDQAAESGSSCCCGESDVKAESCCDGNSKEPLGCKAGCCGSKENASSEVREVTSEASIKSSSAAGETRRDGCCSAELETGTGNGYAGSGNQRTTGTCCDENTGACGSEETKEEPCKSHLEAARRRYTTMFGAMTCLCKALLAQGLESCCTTKRKLSAERIRNAPSSRNRDKCCPPKSSGISTAVRRNGSNIQSLSSRKATPCSRKDPNRQGSTDDMCCSKTKAGLDDCKSGCCEPKIESISHKPAENASQTIDELSTSSNDIERSGASVEHLVLSVQGMTCTGCETKLHRSIQMIDSATNAQASIVLSRAEFDIDPRIISSEQAIAQLERATGFVLTKLSTGGHELHVRATAESKIMTSSKLPFGVLDVRRVDEHTLGISYDANVIGRRDLLERSFEFKLELAPLRPPENISAGAKHVRHVGLMTVLSAVLTIPVLVFAWAPLPEHETAYQSASLGLATIVQVVIAGPFYGSALRSLIFSKVIEMDLLIVLSTSAAYIFSVVAYSCYMAGKPLSTGEFFESSTLLVTLIMIGRFISAFARQKAVESISIPSLQPTTATLVDGEGDVIKEIDSRLLQYGDTFKVLPDSRIVTDGTVNFGSSEVDESMITGESKLVEKKKGSSVVAGSVNGAGLIHVKVARLPGENTISSIADMVDQAKLSKPKIQKFADKVAGYFVPVIVAITVIVFCIWIAIGMLIRHESGSDAVVSALTYAIAVLIVSCPCAVGLAVPMVIVISCGVGAEHGVVFKSAQAIESSHRVTHCIMDKTGTLTEGNASVVEEAYISESADTRSLLLGLVSGNKHPNSTALAKHLTGQEVQAAPLDSLETVVGKGVEGHKDGKLLRAGNAKWMGLGQLEQVQTFQSRSLTTLCFAINGKPQAVFGLADTLRPEAKSVVSALISRGIAVSIVSGDDFGPVQSIGRELGIESKDLRSRCTPEDKQRYVHELTQDKNNIVIFCGDGSNDAGALAQATVGVHMSEGTDVARSASDAVLMRPDISGLLKLMDISNAAFRRIVLNFAWAGIYNLFAILLAAGAFVKFRIPPEYAGLGELVSVLPVILIALHMKWAKF
ncbi:hypothetical protein M409DRAFT_63959 [Zasmidium cellare ATCC 36951]|uniref:HMA domain-containing protein n=1 Tax=Zasmidium cellare ATCC 36951 TaxID=1080233 RepID=A0A6A6CXL1_ZASCE|nr:uncharacterized protein M409DRAFT_63959 [Zasmidium cellare ATCC 36951]KAF2170950.1 hypothetical protein M409DRAFT_63959 [Zasmidium cellare ATCC 36951]